MRLVSALLASSLSWLAHAKTSELLNVFIIQRHGNRAPNPEVLEICPDIAGTHVDDIVREFGAHPGQLTPVGKNLMSEVGKYLYTHYFGGKHPKMVLPVEDRAKYFTFGATTTRRHHESVKLVAEQFFPGTEPPAVVIDDQPDNFLACPPASCVAANHKDASEWLATVGKSVYSNRKPCVMAVQHICGYNFTDADMNAAKANPHPPFQDAVDLIKFRMQTGLELNKHIGSIIDQARQIQFQGIQQRLLGTDEQVVYWMGEVPQKILDSFSSTEKHFGAYVTSREKLYAAQEYYGFEFNCGGILPTGGVYPGTALIFELHALEDGSKAVRIGYYYPGGHPSGDPKHDGELKWLTLPGCHGVQMCPLDQFTEITRQRSKVDGKDFQQICAEKAGKSISLAQDSGSAPVTLYA